MQEYGDIRGYRGEFEMHLTVAAGTADFAALQALAADLGARFMHILLPRGGRLRSAC